MDKKLQDFLKLNDLTKIYAYINSTQLYSANTFKSLFKNDKFWFYTLQYKHIWKWYKHKKYFL